MLAALLFLPFASTQSASQAISLGRTYQKGEKLAYQVLSHITAEERGLHLDTWIPLDIDINYNFTEQVSDLRTDGIAVMHYLRPTVTEIDGETAHSGPQTHIEKTDFDYQLTVSPINEILEQKDLGKKKPDTSKKSDGDWLVPGGEPRQGGLFGQFINEVHRLSLFIGGVQESLDFAPRLPLNSVKVGDTWKRTVGYQPQKLKGKEGKIAVQRLDYTYIYKGPMTVEGKQILRVETTLDFSTDLAEFLKQLLGDRADQTNISKVPLHLKSKIDFNLDPKTHETLLGTATSEGGYQILLDETGSDPVREERFKGSTSITLVNRKLMPK